ncbi:MAG: phenylalanine--tRNA ligase subunit beta [Burkholderiales bacterium]|jgi:phenylalanyl-tRNA synthetase beta chain|nr:phenylalanine--tRNA ligase subunit beta [Burkholderiales bacterium]
MKLSINWLNSYFNSIPNWDDIFHKLTMAGVEVEGVEDTDNDKIVEFKITPNRGDALSVLGILREIRVLTDYTPKNPADKIEFKSDIQNKMHIEIKESKVCSNYQTLIIKNVNNKAVLPNEILKRLEASGNRSISPVVDITNYVMLELGQPLHAFDMDKVGDKLSVRFAQDDEHLHLLADVDAKLNNKTLLICDSDDKPAAIAGVMGGLDSGVTQETTNIVLESAFFAPEVIIGKTKQYGITSDSAYRFERGVDPQLQEKAIKYAAGLIKIYCGGQVGEIASITEPIMAKQINVAYATINRLIGANIPQNTVDNILTKLGFAIKHPEVERNSALVVHNSLNITVPGHRFDINIEEDIIEEIARVYGYDNIEAQMPVTGYTMSVVCQNRESELKIKLVNLGYSEIIGYAFLEDKLESLLGNPQHKAVRLQNPIANLNVMRTSLIADLVKTLEHNINRGHKRMRIFELARVFHGETEDLQPLRLSGLVYGNYANPAWSMPNRSVDFYDLRNDIEILLCGLGQIKFIPEKDNSVFHSGRCAKILLSGREVGILGQLHPKYKAEFSLSELPYIFELDVGGIGYQNPALLVKEVSKFQKASRDLAFLTPFSVNVGDILDTIANANVPYLITANVFDVYQGNKLAHIKLNDTAVKSVAINFLFQGNKTLSDEEINNSMNLIQNSIKEKFTIELRT